MKDQLPKIKKKKFNVKKFLEAARELKETGETFEVKHCKTCTCNKDYE